MEDSLAISTITILERYHLGMVKDEAELAAVEEHLLWCSPCIDRADATAQYVDGLG